MQKLNNLKLTLNNMLTFKNSFNRIVISYYI